MNIHIALNSRLLNDALSELLSKEDQVNHICVARNESEHDGCIPDLIVVDHKSVSHKFASRWPNAYLILLDAGLQQEELISLFLLYKLHGVLSTDADISLMKKALKIVHEGQIWIDSNNLKALIFKSGNSSQGRASETISKREQEVLDLVAQGCKNKDIAGRLCMSEQTVKVHLGHIFKKFNVSSRTQLMSRIMVPVSQTDRV